MQININLSVLHRFLWMQLNDRKTRRKLDFHHDFLQFKFCIYWVMSKYHYIRYRHSSVKLPQGVVKWIISSGTDIITLKIKGYSLKVEQFEWIWCNSEITHEVSGYSLKVEEFEWIWCNGEITYEVSEYSLKVEEFEWIWCNGEISHEASG